jgi:transposase-like protein
MFDVERARSTVHNWVHKADLQPESGQSPDHIAVDEAVIQLNDEQYWLYAAVDPEANELLHTKLEPTTRRFSLIRFSLNSPRNMTSKTPCFSSMARIHYRMCVSATASISDTRNMEIGMLSNVYLEK